MREGTLGSKVPIVRILGESIIMPPISRKSMDVVPANQKPEPCLLVMAFFSRRRIENIWLNFIAFLTFR